METIITGYGSDKNGVFFKCPDCNKNNYMGFYDYSFFEKIHNDNVTCERCGLELIATTDYESLKEN